MMNRRPMSSGVDGADVQRRVELLRKLTTSDGDAAIAKLASDPVLAQHFDAILAKAPKAAEELSQASGAPAGAAASESASDPAVPLDEVPRPTSLQLRRLAVMSGMPFIGFGFLDNALMLLAGDFFDTYLGATLALSTLAAAALGNMVGDTLGIVLGGTVESIAMRMGVPDPNLTAEQRQLNIVQVYKTGSSIVGILIGTTPSKRNYCI